MVAVVAVDCGLLGRIRVAEAAAVQAMEEHQLAVDPIYWLLWLQRYDAMTTTRGRGAAPIVMRWARCRAENIRDALAETSDAVVVVPVTAIVQRVRRELAEYMKSE